MTPLRLGVDLGGTKIEAALLDPDGNCTASLRRPTPRNDYAGTVAAIAEIVAELEEKACEQPPVGIGMPGAISPATGLVKNANSVWLNGKPFHVDLETALGRPVRVANDADCFALSEANDGAGAGASSVFGVILGTGVGGGFVHAGALVSGPNAIGGEWGHNPLPWPREDEWPGPDCYCGKAGCIEAFLSGPALEKFTQDLGGDRAAALSDYIDRLARGLASVINVIDPEIIVLGGGLSAINELYGGVTGLLPKYVFSDTVATRLRPPVHGPAGGVRGAAWLWPLEAE